MKTRKISKNLLPAALFLSVSQVSMAQLVLEEIVVTAQKREQALQDVPISVTAFSGDALDRLGIENEQQIASQTPNLIFRDEGTVPLLVLRGNSLIDYVDGNEATVGFCRDDVYRSTIAGQNGQLFDMERVEVLRGPQGTLYSRNTTAGLLHFISKKPTEKFEGYAQLQSGSDNQQIFEGAISGSLSDSVRGRLSVKKNTDDGWQDNMAVAAEGYPDPLDKFAAQDVLSVRGQLDIDGMRTRENWDRSDYEGVTIRSATPNRVIFELVFQCVNTDGDVYMRIPATWVFVKQNDRWGMQFRSLMASTIE